MNEAIKVWVDRVKPSEWSYRKLAQQAGLSQPLVSRTLSGDMPASADFCIKIANALGESPEMVLRLAGILPPAAPASPADDSTLQELVELARNLSDDDRQQVLDYIRFLYQKRK